MSDLDQSNRTFLYPPGVERKNFAKNFLQQAIVELRFPTILELNRSEPVELQSVLRKKFPLYKHGSQVDVSPAGASRSIATYSFAARRQDPNVELNADHLVLTTRKYQSFEVFYEFLEFLIEGTAPFIDSGFFTRIGLRYINSIGGIPNSKGELADWINPDLVQPISSPHTGTLESFKGDMVGNVDEEGSRYTFRYGLPPEKTGVFYLDYDYYREDVEIEDALRLIRRFHDVHFSFFWWSLGERAREALNNGNAKQG